MNLDLDFINNIIEENKYSTLRDSGIFEDFLRDPVAKNVYVFIQNYYNEYHELPSKHTIMRETMFSAYSPNYKIGYVIDEIKRREAHDNIVSVLKDAGKILAEKDYKKMIETWDEMVKKVTCYLPTKSHVKRLVDCSDEVYRDYERAKNKEYGLLTPYWSLNDLTLGWRGGDYALFGGRSGIGKTFFTMHMLNRFFEEGRKVLYVSPEMSLHALLKRLAGINLKINYKKIRSGELPPISEEIYKSFLRRSDNKIKNIFAMSDDFNFEIKEVIKEIDRIEPEIVFIDGIYLIKAKGFRNRFDQAAFIADEVKRIAKTRNIPVLATTQLNRDAIDLKVSELNQGHFILSDAFAWNADYCFCLGRDKEHESKRLLAVKNVKARESFLDKIILLNWNFESSRFDELTPEEYGQYEKDKKSSNQNPYSKNKTYNIDDNFSSVYKNDKRIKAIEEKAKTFMEEDDIGVF